MDNKNLINKKEFIIQMLYSAGLFHLIHPAAKVDGADPYRGIFFIPHFVDVDSMYALVTRATGARPRG